MTRLHRRALLALAPAALALGACGGEDDAEEFQTPTPEPEPTVEPTPTQDTIGSPVPSYDNAAKWTGRTLTFAGWGGDYQTAQEAAFLTPFAEDTGAGVSIKQADPDLDRLRRQVDEGSVTWDLMTLPAEDVLRLSQEGYLEPIDYNVVERTALLEEVILQYGVGADFFSTVIAHAPDVAAPGGWVDFWTVPAVQEEGDVALPPEAARALRRSPVGTLEFALLADGVALDRLYPIDLVRAFRSLDQIRDNVLVWYEDGKQPIELIIGGQVSMASAWNVRPWQLGVEADIGLVWDGGMLSADMWVVPKGAPNADLAMDFINYATRAIPMANFSRIVPYGPVNPKAMELLREDRLGVLPTSPDNRARQFVQNWAWWADNEQDVHARFENWLLGTSETPPPEEE